MLKFQFRVVIKNRLTIRTLERHFMKQEQYKVRNIMKDKSIVEDLTGYIIPEDNCVNDFFLKLNKERLERLTT